MRYVGWQPHHQQTSDNSQEGKAIEKKAPRGTKQGEEKAAHCRADDATKIKGHRVKGNRVRHIIAAHHLDDKGLACWPIKGIDDAQQSSQRYDLPHLHNMQGS